MKKVLIYLFLLFLTLTLHGQRIGILASSGSNSTLSKGLDAFYNLDESSGTIVDSYGGLNSTASTCLYGLTGKIGLAVEFTSASQYITLPSYTCTAGSSLTINLWIYLDAENTTNEGCFIGNYNGPEFYISTSRGSNVYPIKWYGGDAPASNNATYTPATWYMVTVVKVANTFTFYQNDVNIGSATGQDNTLSNIIYIGGNPNGEAFKGRIDLLSRYHRALGASGVDSLWNGGNGWSYTH
jgi:Concanavalin A-like lectin/glucanases superfamily